MHALVSNFQARNAAIPEEQSEAMLRHVQPAATKREKCAWPSLCAVKRLHERGKSEPT